MTVFYCQKLGLGSLMSRYSTSTLNLCDDGHIFVLPAITVYAGKSSAWFNINLWQMRRFIVSSCPLYVLAQTGKPDRLSIEPLFIFFRDKIKISFSFFDILRAKRLKQKPLNLSSREHCIRWRRHHSQLHEKGTDTEKGPDHCSLCLCHIIKKRKRKTHRTPHTKHTTMYRPELDTMPTNWKDRGVHLFYTAQKSDKSSIRESLSSSFPKVDNKADITLSKVRINFLTRPIVCVRRILNALCNFQINYRSA